MQLSDLHSPRNKPIWSRQGATPTARHHWLILRPASPSGPFPAKFPEPAVVIARYTRGETAIEAYWKSVAWPGQGVFVGEPLAAPFRPRPR
jgi:hypothetical protein